MRTPTKKATTPSGIVSGLYRRLAGRLCSRGSDLSVETLDTETTVIISAMVHTEDHGRMIGVNGQTYQSLLVILRTACDRMGRKLSFTQVKPPGKPSPRGPAVVNEDWDSAWLRSLVAAVCSDLFAYEASVSVVDVGQQTAVKVEIHGAELVEDVRALSEAMAVVFRAIGFNAGRAVVFDLTREGGE